MWQVRVCQFDPLSGREQCQFENVENWAKSMNTYYIYILQCKDNTYYVGVTNNIERRLYEHDHGINDNSYTHNRRPVRLVYTECYQDINEAIRREKQVKNWSQAKKSALIEKNYDKLPSLSHVDFSTGSKWHASQVMLEVTYFLPYNQNATVDLVLFLPIEHLLERFFGDLDFSNHFHLLLPFFLPFEYFALATDISGADDLTIFY